MQRMQNQQPGIESACRLPTAYIYIYAMHARARKPQAQCAPCRTRGRRSAAGWRYLRSRSCRNTPPGNAPPRNGRSVGSRRHPAPPPGKPSAPHGIHQSAVSSHPETDARYSEGCLWVSSHLHVVGNALGHSLCAGRVGAACERIDRKQPRVLQERDHGMSCVKRAARDALVHGLVRWCVQNSATPTTGS
jgi:hypothetical protein